MAETKLEGFWNKIRENKLGNILFKYLDWRNDLLFYAEKPVALGTSIRYFYRFFGILWLITVYIYFIGAFPNDIPIYLIYLTNQTYTLTFIYFITSFLCSSYNALK